VEKPKKKSRQSTFIPQIDNVSLKEWQTLTKIFSETYPRTELCKPPVDKSWEYLFCVFFAFLSTGIIGTDSPIGTFYSLLLSRFNPDNGSFRINDIKRNGENSTSDGRRVYLPELVKIHMLSYCLYVGREMPSKLVANKSGRLAPQSLFPQDEFRKRFRVWISELCRYAGVQKIPSIRTMVNLARIDLLKIYPPFVIGLFSRKVECSPIPNMLTEKRFLDFDKTMKTYPDSMTTNASDEPSVPDDNLSAEIDRNYSKIYDHFYNLAMRSTNQERADIAEMIDSLWKGKHTPVSGQTFTCIDASNFILAADWLSAMLLYSKLSVNTVRTYFFQVSAVLRTDLQGENLNGLSHGDMEAILENCATGSSAKVLKAAMKSFLRYISKVHKIEHGAISWNALSVQSNMKDVPILWPSDVTRILMATDDPQIRQVIRLGFGCGMRISEIAYLNPRDIQLKGEAFLDIKITKSKAGKRRLPLYLLMTEKELEEFSFFYDNSRKSHTCHSTLFVTTGGLPFYNPQVLSSAVKRVMAKAGYRWATFHTLRHSFASLLLMRWFRAYVCSDLADYVWQELGIYDITKDRNLLENGLYSIGGLLGHADIKTTVANYIHTADLIQKAFLNFYERDNRLLLSYSQAIHLTGYSQAGLYKRFTPVNGRQSGIEATELIRLQLKRLRQRMKLATD
jgi:site-specific recombinase XerD